MRYLKKLIVLTVTCILLFSLPIHVSAAVEPGTDDPNATGLITSYSFSCTAGNKRVLINADVAAYQTMAEIGFKNIKVQQSTSSTGSWSNYFEPSNQLTFNTSSHSLEDFLIAVPGGYYYRVQMTLYAKETGWWLPKSQSITVTTNTVWVA